MVNSFEATMPITFCKLKSEKGCIFFCMAEFGDVFKTLLLRGSA